MVDERPVKAKVEIIGAQALTFDPFVPTFDFNLLKVSFNPEIQGKAARLLMEIEDSSATLLNTIQNGDIVKVFLKKATPFDVQPHFFGTVEKHDSIRRDTSELTYELTALGLTNQLFLRIINIIRIQRRLADGLSVDTTDTQTRIDNIVRSLIQDVDAYPTGEPTLEEEGIGVAEVQDSGNTVPQYFAEMKPLSDALKELAEIDDKDFWIDTLGQLNFKSPITKHSGVLFVDDPAEAWDETKKGIILTDQAFRVSKVVEGFTVNRLFGLGGDEPNKDQLQETVSGGPDTLFNTFRAMKFTPDENRISMVAVNIEKLGNPTVDLIGEIRETLDDDNDADDPNGALVKTFVIPRKQITTQEWYLADMGSEILNTKQNYWLILKAAGDASNTYRWFHDAGSASTHATSADGATWTVNSSAKGYGFRTFFSVRLLTTAQDQDSIDKYRLREDVFIDPSIIERQTMLKYVTNSIKTTAKQKRIVSFAAFAPDTIPQIGDMISIKQSKAPALISNLTDFEFIGVGFNLTQEDLGQSVLSIRALDFVK